MMAGSGVFGELAKQQPDVFTAAAESLSYSNLCLAGLKSGYDGGGLSGFCTSAGSHGQSEFPHSVAASLRHGLHCATDAGQMTRHRELTNGPSRAKIVGTDSTKSRSRLGQLPAGPRGNRALLKVAARMSIATAVVATETTEDLDPSVSRCGECTNDGPIGVARWVVDYTGGNIDGEPVERRDYSCDECLPLLLRYARQINENHHAFTPVTMSELALPAWVRAA
jgi:hypothetical protein